MIVQRGTFVGGEDKRRRTLESRVLMLLIFILFDVYYRKLRFLRYCVYCWQQRLNFIYKFLFLWNWSWKKHVFVTLIAGDLGQRLRLWREGDWLFTRRKCFLLGWGPQYFYFDELRIDQQRTALFFEVERRLRLSCRGKRVRLRALLDMTVVETTLILDACRDEYVLERFFFLSFIFFF